MCGIAGIINRKSIVSPSEIVRMCDIISHRGPDDEGYIAILDQGNPLWGEDTPIAVRDSVFPYSPKAHIKSIDGLDSKVVLGHRRLAIIDVSPSGHQPMSYDRDNYWIVLNGEIYNYKELRETLEAKGYSFYSNTDTEVVLASYMEWGVDCQHKLKGMWAFVIYDKQRDAIFMSRDRFGIKPLYYYLADDGNFYFASEIKQFTVLKGWNARLNHNRATDYLFFSVTDHTEETMFKSIFQIRPGSYLYLKINDIDGDKNKLIRQDKWYQPVVKSSNLSFAEASTAFRALFKKSVEQHLQADVEVGAALSGGLDSSSIVCQIDEILRDSQSNHRQRTFSSCAEDKRYSEKKWMDIVVSHTDVEPYFIYPEGKDVFNLTNTILWHLDEPYASQSAFLGYHVFKKASQEGIKVLLNGQGADEYLSGYTAYNSLRKFQLLKHGRVNQLKQEYNVSSFKALLPHLSGLSYFFVPVPFKKIFFRHGRSINRLKSYVDSGFIGNAITHPYEHIHIGRSSVFNFANFQLNYHPLQAYLRWEDRNSMAHSVEARVPFLDHEMVEMATSLPIDYLDGKDQSKKLLRHAMEGLLPYEIQCRSDKKGFMTPEERWVKTDYTKDFREELIKAINQTEGILKPELLDYFDKMVKDEVPFDLFFWRAILFSKWMDVFEVKV